MEISLIFAAAENNVIGQDNRMPWRLSNDLKRFKALTTGQVVIMGRKTFDSLGKPLPQRTNIVVTRDASLNIEGAIVVTSIEEALQAASGHEKVFVIGGGHIYREFWDRADKIYLTRVHATPDGDVTVPSISPDQWTETEREEHPADEKNNYPYSFINYTKKN